MFLIQVGQGAWLPEPGVCPVVPRHGLRLGRTGSPLLTLADGKVEVMEEAYRESRAAELCSRPGPSSREGPSSILAGSQGFWRWELSTRRQRGGDSPLG